MRIETGAAEDHPTPLPTQDTGPGITPLAEMTPTAGQVSGPGGVRDLTGERLGQLAAAEAAISAAQSAGIAAEHGRREHYATDILPQGTSYGDDLNLPPVPDNALPPANSSLYPYPGLEPTAAGAGFDDPAYGT